MATVAVGNAKSRAFADLRAIEARGWCLSRAWIPRSVSRWAKNYVAVRRCYVLLVAEFRTDPEAVAADEAGVLRSEG